MRVTMRQVAERAGVSAMTVSRVINESPRVSEEARQRVEAAIAELGYVPNRLARGLIRQKTGAIGLIVPDVANPFFTLVVRGAEEVAWRAGYHVILCNTQGDLERERGYLQDMLAFQVEGLLIAPVGDRARPSLPSAPMLMIDELAEFSLNGGGAGLGRLHGRKRVDPAEWFFDAHFYEDPVMPGSLGVEAFLQLLMLAADELWPQGKGPMAVAPNRPRNRRATTWPCCARRTGRSTR